MYQDVSETCSDLKGFMKGCVKDMQKICKDVQKMYKGGTPTAATPPPCALPRPPPRRAQGPLHGEPSSPSPSRPVGPVRRRHTRRTV